MSGSVSRASATASSPSRASAQTSNPGRLEQPLEVEADERLVLGDEDTRHAGNTTSARRPPSFSSASSPRSSSRTSARTIESPVPVVSPSNPTPSSAIVRTTSPLRCASAIET